MTVREHLLAACLGLVLPTVAVTDPATAAANAAVGPNETAKTATAVMAVDQHWLGAEVGGDTTWLDAMLMPDYRTVGADGKVGDKAAILRSAMKNRGSDKMRKEVDAWQKAHPTRQSVVLHGDTAILSFSDPKTGHILSSDTFIYQDGGWHALYSQHSKITE
jgi:hypothetical protein